MTKELNNSKGKSWAIIAIYCGLIAGVISAVICLRWHLVIFGFNIMYILSPLLAGLVENFIATRKYGRSSGAISALLTFILINIYGWLLPGWIFPKEPVTLSLITIIAIILTIQAAFPTFVNHLLLVVVPGIFLKIFGSLIKAPSGIIDVIPQETGLIPQSADEIFLDDLTIPLVSVPGLNGGKITKNIGLVVGESIAQEKEVEGRFSKIVNIILPVDLADLNLSDARKKALEKLLINAQTMGANAVVEVIIDYVSMGGLQGSVTIITATGTAVTLEEVTVEKYEDVKIVPSKVIDGDENTPADGEKMNKTTQIDKNNGSFEDNGTINLDDENISLDKNNLFSTDDFDVYGLGLASRDVYGEELEKRFIDVSKDFDNIEHGMTVSNNNSQESSVEGEKTNQIFSKKINLFQDDSELKNQVSSKTKDMGNWFQKRVNGINRTDKTETKDENVVLGKIDTSATKSKATNLLNRFKLNKSDEGKTKIYGGNTSESMESYLSKPTEDMKTNIDGESKSKENENKLTNILGKVKFTNKENKNKFISRSLINSKINQDLIGKEVIDDYANLIGKVKDVDVNLKTNTLESFVVGSGGILESLGSSKDEIIIPRHQVTSIGDKIIINSFTD